MKRYSLLALGLTLAVALTGCVSDRTLSPEERHRAWVCKQDPRIMRFVITTSRLVAAKIRDPDARAAAFRAADAEAAVLANCQG